MVVVVVGGLLVGWGGVEKTAVQTLRDINAVFSAEVCSILLDHHAEDADEGWCQHTSLLQAVVDGEWFYVAIQMEFSFAYFCEAGLGILGDSRLSLESATDLCWHYSL